MQYLRHVALLGALLVAAPAVAEEPSCAPTVDVVRAFADRFGEYEVSRVPALAVPNAYQVLYANPATKTWTVMLELPDGHSCMLSWSAADVLPPA